jgi:hypothetical protein
LKSIRRSTLGSCLLCSLLHLNLSAQPITGVWKGKIHSTKIELKLIKKGDSLVGTSYYYESKNDYRRYTVKGYIDDQTNNVVWWDDQLVENTHPGTPARLIGKDAIMAVADFNCPGEGTMKLDGKSSRRDDRDGAKSPLDLQKVQVSVFADEWDYVLENYSRGANDPTVIDSVALVALAPVASNGTPEWSAEEPSNQENKQPGSTIAPIATPAVEAAPALSTQQKFRSRTKTLQNVIPVTGDSVELRFYDDAEIDGDSIAVYLNGQLLKQDIGLTDQPYKIMIPVNQLDDDNELVMVAENLGSIPPNTSLMVVLIGDKRYEARLFADEHTSALVRFVKESKQK